MAIYSKQRYELRLLLSRMMNDLIKGTVTSPASGTFVCAETAWEKPDDFFNEWLEVFDYSGTGVGKSGKPTDWDNTTHTLTFKPADTLTAGDLVEMHRRFTVTEYNDNINMAIDMAAEHALLNKVDESIDLATDTYLYNLSTQFLYVRQIFQESSTAGLFDLEKPIDPRYWRIIKTSTIQLEFVKELFYPTDGRELRIIGLASPSSLDTDTEACPVNPTWVVNQAAALMHQSRIRGEGSDSEWHVEQMKLCQTMADKIKGGSPSFNVSLTGCRPVVEC
uniref:Uncharacterized protein n=2 Tax=viral metagenome TaxID=1070528 RepID=A0A6M3J384_9ZZZZ